MAIIGERIVRREDPSLLMGAGTFIDNLALDGLAVVTYARSQVAHARVTSIDTSEAAIAAGVIGVFTAADLDLGSVPVDLPMLTAPMPRPFLADGVVRYVGEPIVAIVAESKEHNFNCIWMGTHGRTAIANMVLGSVATRVLHLADVPVVLVP